MESKLRIWRGCVGVRKAFGYGGSVPFYIRNDELDALAQKRPNDYLSVLETWLALLKNQLFYARDGQTAWIVCANAIKGSIEYGCFECELEDGWIRILSFSKTIPDKEWKSLKWIGRK